MAEAVKTKWKWGYFVAGALLSNVCLVIDRLAGFDKLPIAEELLIMLGIGAMLGLITGAVLRAMRKDNP